jgi:hypothetical protein
VNVEPLEIATAKMRPSSTAAARNAPIIRVDYVARGVVVSAENCVAVENALNARIVPLKSRKPRLKKLVLKPHRKSYAFPKSACHGKNVVHQHRAAES